MVKFEIAIKVLCFLVNVVLYSCSNNSHEKIRSEEKSSDVFTLDTLLNDYMTKISTDQPYFKKGIENRLNIQIENVFKDDVVIYTKTSEGTVKLSDDKSEYLIHPALTADSVTIHVNINQDGGIVMIGKIKINAE